MRQPYLHSTLRKLEFPHLLKLRPGDSHALWITIGIGIIAYFLFISQHLLHNHTLRLPWVIENDQIWAGRWFNIILTEINYGADIPVFLPVLSIVMGSLSALVTLKVWRIDLNVVGRVLVMSAIVTFPAALSFFYFSFQTPLFYAGWMFATFAAYVGRSFSLSSIAGASVFVMLLLASYQTSLSVFATIIVTAAIIDLLKPSENNRPIHLLRSAALRLLSGGAAMIGGLALYWLSLRLLEIDPPGTTTITSFAALPGRLLEVFHHALNHLVASQPDLHDPIKHGLLVVLTAAVLLTLWHLRKALILVPFALLLWVLAIIATKAIFVIVSPDGSFYEYRYNSSLGFLHAFSFLIILKLSDRLFWIAALVSGFFVLRFVQADLVRQEVLFRGQQHDLALANRILMRMESLPELDASKTYDLVRVGHYSFYRLSLLRSGGHSYDRLGDGHMDTGEISDRWVDEEVFKLLGSSIKFKYSLTDPAFSVKAESARKSLLADRQPWPAPESVFIHEDTIYIYMR